jgi:hypothetical protein
LYEDYKLENFRQIFVTDERQFGNKLEKTVPGIEDDEEEEEQEGRERERERKRCKLK